MLRIRLTQTVALTDVLPRHVITLFVPGQKILAWLLLLLNNIMMQMLQSLKIMNGRCRAYHKYLDLYKMLTIKETGYELV